MEITFHSHHATVSEVMRRRALTAIEKVAKRLTRIVAADVRFEEDGRLRRVEVVLYARRRRIVAEGTARLFGTALAAALAHAESRTRRAKRPAKERARRLARG